MRGVGCMLDIQRADTDWWLNAPALRLAAAHTGQAVLCSYSLDLLTCVLTRLPAQDKSFYSYLLYLNGALQFPGLWALLPCDETPLTSCLVPSQPRASSLSGHPHAPSLSHPHAPSLSHPHAPSLSHPHTRTLTRPPSLSARQTSRRSTKRSIRRSQAMRRTQKINQ